MASLALDRDPIFQALLARLRAIPDLGAVEDRFRPWSSVDAGETPCAYLVKGSETPSNERGFPPKWRISAKLYLYTHSANRMDMSAQRQANILLTRIEAALERTEAEVQGGDLPYATTLGGLVSHAWIDGPVDTDEGTLGDLAVHIIPIDIMATG